MAEEAKKKPRKPYTRKSQQTLPSKEKPNQIDVSQNVGIDLEKSTVKSENDKLPVQSKVATKKKIERKQISVCSIPVQFYRAGMRFSTKPTTLFVDSLKPGVLERLKNERWLVVTEM